MPVSVGSGESRPSPGSDSLRSKAHARGQARLQRDAGLAQPDRRSPSLPHSILVAGTPARGGLTAAHDSQTPSISPLPRNYLPHVRYVNAYDISANNEKSQERLV